MSSGDGPGRQAPNGESNYCLVNVPRSKERARIIDVTLLKSGVFHTPGGLAHPKCAERSIIVRLLAR